MTDEMLNFALTYAALGWRVFPCGQDKHPVITSTGKPLAWSKWATCNANHVGEMWARYPGANIGVACGQSGLIVLDMDCKNGANGRSSLEALKSRLGFSTITLAQFTPSGGLHLIYAANGAQVGCSVGKLGPGLDIRGGGGYILIAPSRTPTGAYRWVDTASPFEAGPIPFPKPLIDLLNARPEPPPPPKRRGVMLKPHRKGFGYVGAALAGEIERVASSQPGNRNNSLNLAAFKLYRFVEAGALDKDATENALLSAALSVGLPEREALATIRSGFKGRWVS